MIRRMCLGGLALRRMAEFKVLVLVLVSGRRGDGVEEILISL